MPNKYTKTDMYIPKYKRDKVKMLLKLPPDAYLDFYLTVHQANEYYEMCALIRDEILRREKLRYEQKKVSTHPNKSPMVTPKLSRIK